MHQRKINLLKYFFISFRINLDLRVTNEELKNSLNEKTDLLRKAYEALESLEGEKLRERSQYENEIESLKQTLFDTQVRASYSKVIGSQAGSI